MEQKRDLFTRLERLFSNDVVIRNTGGNQLKVIDINHIQTRGDIKTNSLIDRFSRIHRNNNYNMFTTNPNYQTLRVQLYVDYEAMDSEAIIATALDIISAESTLKNEAGEVLQIRSSDDNIQKILYNLFYDVLNIEFNLGAWIRNMCKYGDCYLHLEIAEKFGIYNVRPLSIYEVSRQEGQDENNPSKVEFLVDPAAMGGAVTKSQSGYTLQHYEVAHFRLISDANFLPYGRSYLEPGRRVYKQYVLMKDAMLVHRIMRAPEKRVYYMNVGGIAPNEVDAFVQKTMNNMKKTPYIDPQTGEYNLKYNMQNLTEDVYIPVRNGDNVTKIDTLKGLEYNGIEDVAYLRDELFAALKVPKAFYGYDKDLCISPDTLIPLLDGRTITVQEIINEYNDGIKNYVYSIDEETENIVPGEIEWAGFTRMNTEVLRVWLDNNKFIDCTPDHLFLTREGEWKEAQHLEENESLMPLLNKNIEFKVLKIEWLEEKIDTCDLTISKYHNFGTEAGVIIHNSGKATLASEDMRFARTIEQIQRIIISELYKIAMVHLYTQGYNDESLVNFELALTTPSIIYQQEKIELWKGKVELAKSIQETNLLPSDWIYDNIFELGEDGINEFRDLVLEDKKREFRATQIENEGNDPLKSGKSFGTPHDLASLYGKGRSGNGEVPIGYDETSDVGRPKEKWNNYGSQEHALGKDPIGKKICILKKH